MEIIIAFALGTLTTGIPLFYLDSQTWKQVNYWRTKFYQEKSLVENYWNKVRKREPIEFCEGLTYVLKEVD